MLRTLLPAKPILAGVLTSILLVGAHAARADLVISAAPTSHVACANGICTATAASAVLNVTTLKTMLAARNVYVGTTTAADAIDVKVPFGWSSAHTLSFEAKKLVTIGAPISVVGNGGLSIVTKAGDINGTINYTGNGRVVFRRLSSALSMNGASYKLVNSISGLAKAAAASTSARVALSDNIDAQADGVYRSPPVPQFSGIFDGLGNTISNLKIADSAVAANVGLFGAVTRGCNRCGHINRVNLVNVSAVGGNNALVGGLVGNMGAQASRVTVSGVVVGGAGARVGGVAGAAIVSTIRESHSSAIVRGGAQSQVGGLAGSAGYVYFSSATGSVLGGENSIVGGLVGLGGASITQSFATGGVSAAGAGSSVGGLVGMEDVNAEYSPSIVDCYARGSVKDAAAGAPSAVGGLIGNARATASRSYSTGRITAGAPDVKGGFVGTHQPPNIGPLGSMKSDYWDRITSGISNPGAGAGNIPNDAGIKGLTTAEFTASLPAAFPPSVWGRKAGVNGGLPYLIANPPE